MNTNDIEIRFSDLENRLEFSENRYRVAVRKMKVQSLLGLTALGITLCFSSIPHAMAQGYGTSLSTLISEVKALQTQQSTDMSNISNLQSQQTSLSQSYNNLQTTVSSNTSLITQLNFKTSCLSLTKSGLVIAAPTITLEDGNNPAGAAPTQLQMQGSNVNIISANLGLENGLGGTYSISLSNTGNLLQAQAPVNGLGNLIIGYDTNGKIAGSHNLIMGYDNNAYSFGAIVGGLYNTSIAPFSSVMNGYQNTGGGLCSSILGGQNNATNGGFGFVANGIYSSTYGNYDSVIGGYMCSVFDLDSAILGGYNVTLDTGNQFTFYP